MNQWSGIVEWNTGMEYWNRLINAKKLNYPSLENFCLELFRC